MRMFKNCPGERHGRQCAECPLLKKCLVKKVKRKLKKNRLKILWILILLVAIVILFNMKPEADNKQLEERSYLVTNDVSTEKNQVTKLKVTVQAKDVVNPTTPKATNRPKVKKKGEELTKTKKVSDVTKNKKTRSKKSKAKSSKKLNNYFSFSDSDKKLIEKIVYAESRGEPFEGQIAVAAVILNRYMFYKQQKSIKEIVTAPYQFADISTVTQDMLDGYPNCKKAVEEALEGNDPTKIKFSEGARYFFEPNLISGHQKEIREGIEILQIGNHYFHNNFNE